MGEKKGFNRRDFLKIVGATTGVAAAGCGKDVPEKLIPYVIQPDDVVPGVATWYSGACGECAAGCGVMIRTREGRAVKAEGNPQHPINRGGLCAVGQSSLQGLYDPDRIREPLKRDVNGNFKPVSWKEALDAVAEAISTGVKAGKETILITKPSSGSEKDLLQEFAGSLNGVSQIEFDLFSREIFDRAAEESFGPGSRLNFDFSKAETVVSFGADYLETWLNPVAFTKDYATRRVPDASGNISKVYHVEPRLSLTAANADTWVKNRPGTECLIMEALLQEVSGKTTDSKRNSETLLKDTNVSVERVKEIAASLKANAGKSLVVAGGVATSGTQAKRCALLANAINNELGNIGTTVLVYKTAPSGKTPAYEQLLQLAKRLTSDKHSVGVAILAGVNPAFTLPDKSGFKEGLGRVPLVVALSTHLDETAKIAQIVLPMSTSFEAWGDSVPLPGVYNLNQPAMQPLYKSESLGDLIIALAAHPKVAKPIGELRSFYDYLRQQWKKRTGEANFENRWLQYVERGGDWSGGVKYASAGKIGQIKLPEIPYPKVEGLSLLAFPTVHYSDGSSANRPWMQETPDPMTTAIWATWVQVHPDTAARYGIASGTVVQVRTAYGTLEAPVYISTQIAPDVVAVPIGQGRSGIGRYSNGVGSNPLSLLPPEAIDGGMQFIVHGVDLEKSVAREELVVTHFSDTQLGRGFIRTVSKAALVAGGAAHGHEHADHSGAHGGEQHAAGHSDSGHSDSGHGDGHAASETKPPYSGMGHHNPLELGPHQPQAQMYKQLEPPVYRWGMSVDISRCTGCSACVVACYAENNIPVVGKEICSQGREMSWLRIERYFDGPEEAPVLGFLPMMCQHCGNAPCEPVCPVYATYHSDEGLNTMVYNRCVGTRYCSNNCTYKVRRFNWWKYTLPTPLTWQLNPDVTQREIGVMEKCSFCIQRIREVENKAKNDGRTVRDGEIQPACASSCPAEAIKFGNLLDKESTVYHDSQSPRSYRILHAEINTHPAVYYLARVTHDELEASKA